VSASGSSKSGTSGPITVSPAAASALLVTAPASTGSDVPFDITVTARDPYGNTATSYLGTVHVTSDDGSATLPGDYTFVGGDAGSRVFAGGVVLHASGSVTLTATDVAYPSITGSVVVSDGATYLSSSGWAASFSTSRYLLLTIPPYVPSGAVVTSATFYQRYRSASSGTTCTYFEVYSGATLLATHGGPGSPVSCDTGTSFQADAIALPEIDTAAKADSVVIKLFVSNSTGDRSEHSLATVGITYYLP
jgi:hypothetical protein